MKPNTKTGTVRGRALAIAAVVTTLALLAAATAIAAEVGVTVQKPTSSELMLFTRLYAGYRHIPESDISGVEAPTSQAFDEQTHTAWAVVGFTPSNQASYNVKLGFQDGGGTGIFERMSTGTWRMVSKGIEGPYCGTKLPPNIQQAFGFDTTYCPPAPNLPAMFADQIATINQTQGAPPVLLPTTMPLNVTDAQTGSVTASGDSYDISLGTSAHCDGINICNIVHLWASRGQALYGKRITIPGATSASYPGLQCAAVCNPPVIEFIVNGVTYSIAAYIAGKTQESGLIAAAESAIQAGPRT